MRDPEILKEVNRWLHYAHDDLAAGVVLLERDELPPRIACFHAQQAAEKAIKAALIFLQVHFPKTHNLVLLIEALPEGWRLKERPSSLSDLGEWAVEPRYPGDVPEATRQDAETAIEQARSVYETALRDLERHGYDQVGEET
jgi:HEPN domain-containing protein